MSLAAHLVTGDLVVKILPVFFSHLAGSIFWCKPHSGRHPGHGIHLHPEMSQAHIMNHIFCINDQFQWFSYHHMHFLGNIHVIMIIRVAPYLPERVTLCFIDLLKILPSKLSIFARITEFPAKLFPCYFYHLRIFWRLPSNLEPVV